MRRTAGALVGFVVLALVVAAAPAAGAPEGPPRSYIVVFHDSVDDPGAAAAEHRRAHGAQVNRVYRHALRGYAASMSEQAAARVADDRRVAFVEPDGVVTAIETQSSATWGLDRIDQRALPLSGTYTYGTTGLGVTAYIIDTGIEIDHLDFGTRAVHGTDTVDGDANADDCNGHGTHVAGTVGGTTWGVAKAVTLVAVRVLNCNGSGTWSGVIAGIDWVTGHHQAGTPAVANMSLGGGASSAVDVAVQNSIKDGVSYGVAAGNGNRAGIAQDACDYSPSRVPEALTVGATNSSDKKASWSNYGTCLDLFAPGVSITSAWHTSNTATNTISGTSMATPHVVGAAALYLEANPSHAPSQVATAITTNATAGVVGNAGSGSPNLLLYTGASGSGGGGGDSTPTAPPAAPSNLVATAMSSSQINLSWSDVGGEESYKIEHGADGINFTLLATVPADITTYSHTGLAPGSTHHYRVLATNSSGDSGYSSPASATTTAASTSIILDGSASKVKGRTTVTLSWAGTTAAVDVYRNGINVDTDNASPWTESFQGGGSWTYKVCEGGTQTCSNEVRLAT